MRKKIAGLALLLVLTLALPAVAQRYAFLLAGDPLSFNNPTAADPLSLGGLDNDFFRNSMKMYGLLKERGYTENEISFLYNQGEGSPAVDGEASKANVVRTFTNSGVKEGDQVFVYIIGHGGWSEKKMWLNLPGEKQFDLNGVELNGLLNDLGGNQIIVIDTCFADGWRTHLMGPKRVIITSSAGFQESLGELSYLLIKQLEIGNWQVKEVFTNIRKAYLEKIKKSPMARGFGIKDFSYWSSTVENDSWEI